LERVIARPRTITDERALSLARACIVEHGPGVSLAKLSKAVGLSPPALLKRFGSKERLLFRALLPSGPPAWWQTLAAEPGPDARAVLVDVLTELCDTFVDVGPALAALRMSTVDVDTVFPPDALAPPVRVRRMLATWLSRAGATGDTEALADAMVGAAEARGYLTWVGPQLVEGRSTREWAERMAALGLP